MAMVSPRLLRGLIAPLSPTDWLPYPQLLTSVSLLHQWLPSLALPTRLCCTSCSDAFKLLLVMPPASATLAEVRFIASSSMAPMLRPGDRAVVEKVTYLFRRPSVAEKLSMDTTVTAAADRAYEDFVPPHNMVTEPATHTLSVDLTATGYKKEHIRVLLVRNHGLVVIRGERPVVGNLWSRFRARRWLLRRSPCRPSPQIWCQGAYGGDGHDSNGTSSATTMAWM